MEKLKDMKVKHNHTLTDILKVLIFSLVMLAPFGAVLSKCLYTTFNKNAKDSYYGETINEVNVISANNNYIVGQEYKLTIGNLPNVTQQEVKLNVSNVKSDNITGITNTNTIYIRTNTNNNTYVFFYNDGTYITDKMISVGTTYTVYFIYLETYNTNQLVNEYKDIITFETYNNYSYLDNGFYYAVNELSDQPLFSWTKNTFIYSTINQMTTGLDFGNNNVLALLLTYWILNTMIYIIFDIIIEVFKKLTHAFN